MYGSHILSRSNSPLRRSSSSSASGDNGEHPWTSFEIRTLFCLIIKGEHYDRKGPVDPIDFATKLNNAVNPGTTATKNDSAYYDRDIPVNDVQKMLRRVLIKKRHGCDVVQRGAAAVTRRQLNVFMRQLDFNGSAEEWYIEDRKKKIAGERAELKRQLDKRTDGRPVSQERWNRNQDKLREIHSPRARKLLEVWGLGHTFFEEPAWRTTATAQTSEAARGRIITRNLRGDGHESSASRSDGISNASNGGTTDTSVSIRNGGSNAKSLDDTLRSGDRTPAWDVAARTPAWGIDASCNTAFTPNVMAATSKPTGGGWGGGFADPSPKPVSGFSGDYGGGYGGYGAASPLDKVLSSSVPAYSNGYGEASASVRSGAPTPDYGNGYGAVSPLVQVSLSRPAYSGGYDDTSPVMQSNAPTPAHGNDYGSTRSNAPTPAYGNGYGATSPSMQSGAPSAGFGNQPARPTHPAKYYVAADEFDDGERQVMPPPKTSSQRIGVTKTGSNKARRNSQRR